MSVRLVRNSLVPIAASDEPSIEAEPAQKKHISREENSEVKKGWTVTLTLCQCHGY